MPEHQAKTDYVRDLSEKARLRVKMERTGKRIDEYVLQLEAYVGENWREVVRYDNCHGSSCHRHVFRIDGAEHTYPVDSNPDPVLGYAGAMHGARRELTAGWERMCRRFRKGRWPV